VYTLSMKILVTAGGQGTKLWPYSREHKPKQFQPVVGDTSLYTETIQTLLKKFAPEDIFISSKRKFIKYISEQSPEVPLKNYIIEPDVAKDRGPGEGLAFLRLSVLHPDEPFFLVQADCIREPEAAFLQMIEDAGKIVQKEKRLLTGGIKATEANMGVDYLMLGERLEQYTTQEVYEVKEFVYRGTTYKETKELIENFHVVTHPQHYCWYPDLMLEAYKKHRPDWHKALMAIKAAFDKPGEDAAIAAIYHTMEKGPTEEVTKHIMGTPKSGVILLPFKWTDIGTWGSVYEYFVDGDGTENYADGKAVVVETKGTFIKTSSDKKLVAVAGIEDMVIIDTDDVLLIIPKNKIEKIKDIQKLLGDRGEKEYL
jgi:mannose-1-phosphate guanylyltransferase